MRAAALALLPPTRSLARLLNSPQVAVEHGKRRCRTYPGLKQRLPKKRR